MICSTFVEHLYTENEENDDFAMKKHEFGMENEWFLQNFLWPSIIPTIVNALIFHEKMMAFLSKMIIFYMICSTFLEHLYTENKENDDFAVKKHEFGMKNEWFLHIFFGPFTYR